MTKSTFPGPIKYNVAQCIQGDVLNMSAAVFDARVTASVVAVGTAIWLNANGLIVTNKANSVDGAVAGIIIRSNDTPYAVADTYQGNSLLIDAGMTVQFLKRGEMAVAYVNLAPANGVSINQDVYVEDLTGIITIGVSDEVGYTKLTNFKISQIMNNGDLIAISTYANA